MKSFNSSNFVIGLFINKAHIIKRKYTTYINNLDPLFVTGFCDALL